MPRVKSKSSEEINIAKNERKNIQELQKRMRPGECQKYIKVLIDPEFLCGAPGSEILSNLANLNIKYEIRRSKVPRIILWERLEQQTLLKTSDQTVGISDRYKLENQLILLMYGEELITDDSFGNTISEIKKSYPGIFITFLIFGLKKYCKSKRIEIETALTEIQIVHDCNCRMHETASEVAATISQFTKAVSEIPFKKQQSDKLSDANLFLLNDNKDCVRVEGTAGLSRLWQQHLTRLPLVTLETAEAVINAYPCPSTLIKAYECHDNGPNALADLKIRRAGGPLQSIRRIGPEMSKKIYTLYNSLDGNEIL